MWETLNNFIIAKPFIHLGWLCKGHLKVIDLHHTFSVNYHRNSLFLLPRGQRQENWAHRKGQTSFICAIRQKGKRLNLMQVKDEKKKTKKRKHWKIQTDLQEITERNQESGYGGVARRQQLSGKDWNSGTKLAQELAHKEGIFWGCELFSDEFYSTLYGCDCWKSIERKKQKHSKQTEQKAQCCV